MLRRWDLKAAREAKTEEKNSPVPAWEPVIEAYCRYDSEASKGMTRTKLRSSPAFVSFLIVENNHVWAKQLTTGAKTLTLVPECYSVCDSMGRFNGVSNQHNPSRRSVRLYFARQSRRG